MSDAALQQPSARDDARQEADEDRIVVENAYKIFGGNPDEAYRLLGEGKTKDQIFRETGATVAVQDASFTVKSGEVFVIMGLSGSGKSTMVRMLNRLIDPTFGTVSINGQNITAMNRKALIDLRRRDMSMVFQSFALMPHQTVLENAAFGLTVSGRDKADREARALEALEAVGLGQNARSYPSELSGGMKQRVGLARALANDPPVLLMDEAFSALDPLIRTEMQDELIRLQREHRRTIVFISHDLDEAMRIGDRIAIMQDGRFVQIDTPDKIVSEPANDYVRSFFRNVDVTQVFKAGDIADPGVQPGDGVTEISADASLDEVLSIVSNADGPAPVTGEDGKRLGAISKTALLKTFDKSR
ncbi:betaine/proline/choline family ABC transporter ATP-binding protein [Marivibrio halodurans]|uniref:Quaternary amine transport ATP-binding protein n=1 Tax=Marivibrio halodurans TaxID=2039722 RepID=A0A8J7S2K9_9PROT|nr:betaine/proline/choline family ABC transporter ATP-binding protein [Marivibrio halodurans]MBP5855549.1 betaine/proline/choline family ABC transporter ATP-binding protein [Marivibrio halodurans]